MKCSVALDRFLYQQELKNNSEETISYYKQRIGYFIDFINDKNIKKVSVGDYDNYLLYLKNKNVAEATIKTSLTAVRVFLNFCYRNKFLRKDIVSGLGTYKIREKNYCGFI